MVAFCELLLITNVVPLLLGTLYFHSNVNKAIVPKITSSSENYVTYFIEGEAKHTDKVFYGRVSEAIKIGVENGL